MKKSFCDFCGAETTLNFHCSLPRPLKEYRDGKQIGEMTVGIPLLYDEYDICGKCLMATYKTMWRFKQ